MPRRGDDTHPVHLFAEPLERRKSPKGLAIVSIANMLASAYGASGGPQRRGNSPVVEFIARENIKSFKAQLRLAAEGPRKAIICGLLATEEHDLREWLTAKE